MVSQISALEIIAVGFEADPRFHHSSQARINPLNLVRIIGDDLPQRPPVIALRLEVTGEGAVRE